MPTTTPAAMPALFGPLEGGTLVVVMIVSFALVWPGAVTTIVLALVTTDGGCFFVGVGDAAAGAGVDDEDTALELESEFESVFEDELCSLPTLSSSPVSWTDQALGPPPITLLVCRLQAGSGTTYTYPCHNRYS